MKKIILIGLIAILSVSCTTPNIMISDNLKTDTKVMEVKGRQGWQFNQIIKFGDYTTSKVQRGWTAKYDIPLKFHFEGAKQKFTFNQFTPDGKQAEILAISKFSSQEVDLYKEYLSVPLEYNNTFTGCVIPVDNKPYYWDFIIYNPEGEISKTSVCGNIQAITGQSITVKAVRKLEGVKPIIQLENYGFEFVLDGVAIGAVSTLNNGKVWIKNNISPELKMVVASVSTSLLLRQSMTETNE